MQKSITYASTSNSVDVVFAVVREVVVLQMVNVSKSKATKQENTHNDVSNILDVCTSWTDTKDRSRTKDNAARI